MSPSVPHGSHIQGPLGTPDAFPGHRSRIGERFVGAIREVRYVLLQHRQILAVGQHQVLPRWEVSTEGRLHSVICHVPRRDPGLRPVRHLYV